MIALKFDGAYDLEQWMVRIRERLFDQRQKGLCVLLVSWLPNASGLLGGVQQVLSCLFIPAHNKLPLSRVVQELSHHRRDPKNILGFARGQHMVDLPNGIRFRRRKTGIEAAQIDIHRSRYSGQSRYGGCA